MKVLFCISDGIGNVFQALPVVSTLERTHGWDFSFLFCGTNYPLTSRVLGRPVMKLGTVTESDIRGFDGIIATGKAWDKINDHFIGLDALLINDPASQYLRQVKKWTRSEVDWRLDIARSLGCEEMIYDYALSVQDPDKRYDVVIANGYNLNGNDKDKWHIKQYARWADVVKILKNDIPDIKIASLGTDHAKEYVAGTESLIGLPIEQSLEHVKASKVLLCNDTGLYHASQLLGTKAIVFFSFTDQIKGFDKRFHKSADKVSLELPCMYQCFKQRKVHQCKNHICRYYDPADIVDRALREIKR